MVRSNVLHSGTVVVATEQAACLKIASAHILFCHAPRAQTVCAGAVAYTLTLGLVFYVMHRDTQSGGSLFAFFGDKFEDKYYYWELIVIVRKVLVMSVTRIFGSNVPTAWFLGSLISAVSLILHSLAQPYEDGMIDFCELISLGSMLCLQQTTMLHWALSGRDGEASSMPAMLTLSTWLGVATVLVNVGVNLWAQAIVWRKIIQMTDDEESDYKVMLKAAHLETLRSEASRIQVQLETARSAQRAHVAMVRALQDKSAMDKSFEAETQNPLPKLDDDADNAERTDNSTNS
jgi:hypothetical protein